MPDTFPPDDDALKETPTINSFAADNSTATLSMGWLLPLLLLVLAAGLFFYFRNGSANSVATVPQFVIQPSDTIVKKAPVLPDSTKR